MTRRRKWLLWILSGGFAFFLVAFAAGVLILQSHWFYDRVRERLISTVETATGGRVEIGAFRFYWRQLRGEVDSFTLHGTEPAGSPPLFHANSVVIGIKIVSTFRRDVDIAYLDITGPQVYLLIGADGRTNVPEPKVTRQPGKPVVQSILDLAIGRFSLRDGQFEIASRGKTPFSASGRNLHAAFAYDLNGPRYHGDISIQPLDLDAASYHLLPVGIATSLTVAANRIDVKSARLTSGASNLRLSGTLENLADPRAAFQFDASVSVQETTPILRIPELHHGTMQLRGNGSWKGGQVLVTSTLHGFDLAYRDPSVRLEGFRADGALTANNKGVDVNGLRLNGHYVTDKGRAPLDARIDAARLRGKDLQLQGMALSLFGGTFQGDAKVLNLVRYSVAGEIAGIQARPVVAMYSPEHLPWDALATGPVTVEGSFENSRELRATANLAVTPAPESAAVHGQISATYLARDRTLDLGRSTVTLPSSRVDFSGTLGRQMRAHLETRNLDDLLPAIGERAANLPAQLTGTAIFDGTVTGPIDTPQISGRARVTGFEFEHQHFDTLDTDAAVSPSQVHLRNARVTQGGMRGQLEITVGLDDWKTSDATPLAGSGSVRGATVAGLSGLLEIEDLPVAGGAAGSAQLSGTVGDPHVAADFQLTAGTLWDEPFDRFNGHLNYTADSLELLNGELAAGDGRAALGAVYRHPLGHFNNGHLQAHATTNSHPLEEIRTLQSQFPGLRGTVQTSVNGEADLSPGAGKGSLAIRLTAINGDITTHNLRISEQALGDAHLVVTSQNGTAHAHLESNAANSVVRGDGEWRLAGDYQGKATVSFSKLDLAELRAWLQPALATEASPFAGSVEGELTVEGPLAQPQSLTAALTIPSFTFGPTPAAGIPTTRLTLHNSGPIVARMADDVVTVESAHLTGEGTDLRIGGKIALRQKSAIDLNAQGKVDLAIVRDFNRDFTSSGSVSVDASVRGSFDAPQINGRTEFEKASFAIDGVPNGISGASGVIIFTGDKTTGTRATIQNFKGETGGGQIELTGFAGYSDGQSIFRIHVRADQVRIRYPEGVSTVANASLNLTGSEERSNLEGSVTIVRTGFNPQSDFSSLLASSAQPVQTPAARTGLLGGLNFDVQINTAPDVQFQSSLTQDVQMEANLRLRGTFSNPAVLGRINITQGQLVFFGTKYTINQGSVQFFNPVRIAPILDVDLETKANGIDVTLNISGPFNKPNLTPRSDPPLQFNEIVALLATGRSPTSDPARLTQESTAPQSWQQMGASALLGQAIASPVAGRLQRFFGVSQLRIDPTLSGVENNPQARITLEQQVTPDITFTYITNVTNSNPQVVRVEWSFAKQWSVVALREENGLFGMDFFYKKRF